MSVRMLVEDTTALYERERFHSAFTLALIAVEATAKVRYPKQRPGNRFKAFLNDETSTHNMRVKCRVDLPPQPDVGEAPRFRPPEDSDDWDALKEATDKYVTESNAWHKKRDAEYGAYKGRIKDVGDAFEGEWSMGKWVCYLGVSRLVTTTGILYQVRCELVHEGNLSTIRIVPPPDKGSLMVGGVDPIKFSATWIREVVGLVVRAKENRGLFSR